MTQQEFHSKFTLGLMEDEPAKMFEDIIDSIALAMISEGIEVPVIKAVCGAVEDYIVNQWGDA